MSVPDLDRAATSVDMWAWDWYCAGKASHPHLLKRLKMPKKCLHGIFHCIQSKHVHDGSPVEVPKSTLCNLVEDPLIINTPMSVS